MSANYVFVRDLDSFIFTLVAVLFLEQDYRGSFFPFSHHDDVAEVKLATLNTPQLSSTLFCCGRR